MNTIPTPSLRRLAGAAIALCSLGIAAQARAENHALIMTIDYIGTRAQLPPTGIEADGRMATQMAQGMGVPAANIRWLRNGSLGLEGMTVAIEDMTRNRIGEGDKVFVYYSGHGTQTENAGGRSKCTEGMVAADLRPYTDERLEAALDALSAKASQVVMLNDSCFSGGQATKSLDHGLGDGAVAKVFYSEKSGAASDADYACNQPVNKSGLSRTLGVVGARASTRMLYVAASADNEVSWALPSGSTATVAWSRCLANREADRDGNGIIDGEELRTCAQALIDAAGGKRQTITLRGEAGLPLSFLAGAGASASASSAPVSNPAQALETLRLAADPTIRVEVSIKNARLKIDRDLLDFSVRTERPGYLYLLHIGTDGKFYQLFPNARDSNNFLNAGSHSFPRPAWGIQAQGPEGSGYVMAYLSSAPRNFTKGMATEGGFATAASTAATVHKLGVVALDGRYGASRVATIEEVR